MYRYFAWLVLILIIMAIINKFRERPWNSGRVAVVILLLFYIYEMVVVFMLPGSQQELMGYTTADALIPVLIAGVLDRRFLNRRCAVADGRSGAPGCKEAQNHADQANN